MNQTELAREVETVIDERLALNEPAAMTWVVHAVVSNRSRISGEDCDFYRLCAYSHVRKTVRDVLRGRSAEEGQVEVPQSELFPGYKRLQRSYTIERGDEQMIVPIEQMTPDEIELKAYELDTLAAGAKAHARELRDYLDARQHAAATA